ncbi:MAG TPA: M60 family peptidase N-terminal accessory domain-containing protein [Saprospiraceae bacterium]|nr:M60 family peptidase N-terminal accessory domain-containing protein [Saprospiraceae bacterium]HMQ82076.1 M60 family peptidase N-terminal accessory domain-containing protein [Saprospiraceae bacterium]
MKKLGWIVFFLVLVTGFGFAQCGVGELLVRVDIATDNWGEETSWKLSDLAGTTILQGGQNGVYDDFSTYSDSTCVPANSCLFFEIYDTYGDGIYAPYGYQLFVDGVLVSSGADDIQSYAIVIVNCSDPCGIVLNALNDLKAHINGTTTLTTSELTLVKNTFVQFSECLAESESILLLSKTVVEDYDNQFGALFTTPSTAYGFSKDPAAAPGLELERAMLALQQGVFDYVFTPAVYALYPQHFDGWKFNSCTAFPGYVAPPTDPTLSNLVQIRANFEDPDGMNPYYDINQDRMEHALRPTGLYLSPGSIASITVPDDLVGKDYWVRVGSHDWDLTERTEFRRLDRISKKFEINSSTIEVFNPLGGAISILVPYGANDGIVEISVNNGVEAPFFSWKTFHKTSDFDAELSKPGPWAVFETDNVMYTIPKHSIVPGQYDLKQTMLDWDAALQGVNSIMARQIIPDKHNMYMIADLDIRTGVYSIGYPMSNTPLNYNDVPGPAYFINGPGPDDEVNFHESGHALAMSKFPGEEEAIVNFPYIMALNYGLGQDLEEAVNYSFVPNTYGIDNTATHRMVSNTFGIERDISNTTTDEVRYQHRGYGHYFEIVNLFGWCPLRNFWKQEFIDFENGINHGINDQNIDSRMVRMSVGAQADLRPLFHVFGLVSQDSAAVQSTLEQLGVLPSPIVYNRLQAYFDLIPENKTAFINYALSVYPTLYTEGPTAHPDYGVGWHYLKSLTYDEAEAQSRAAILQSIIDRYFPDGEPANNENPDLCCLLDTLVFDLLNQEIMVTGGVEPYHISMDTTGNTITVTVVDFDGCETTAQYTFTGLSEEGTTEISIYPNPSSTEIYIDLTEGRDRQEIEGMQMVSINGQVLQIYGKHSRIIDISALSEGLYILQINLVGGEQINKRVLILRQ